MRKYVPYIYSLLTVFLSLLVIYAGFDLSSILLPFAQKYAYIILILSILFLPFSGLYFASFKLGIKLNTLHALSFIFITSALLAFSVAYLFLHQDLSPIYLKSTIVFLPTFLMGLFYLFTLAGSINCPNCSSYAEYKHQAFIKFKRETEISTFIKRLISKQDYADVSYLASLADRKGKKKVKNKQGVLLRVSIYSCPRCNIDILDVIITKDKKTIVSALIKWENDGIVHLFKSNKT